MDSPPPASRVGSLIICVSFFLSGAAGLGYEIVWTRLFSVALGHEYISVLAVVGAFFGGIGLGAWTLDGVISRSRRPGVWYAGLEAVVAIWALVTLWLIPILNDQVALLIGTTPSQTRHWLIAFGVPLIALLPATAAIGATLPAIDRLCCRIQQQGRSVATLYAINTLGAVAGVLVTTYFLVPAFGYRISTLVLVALSLTCTTLILLGPARMEVRRLDVVVPTETGLGTRRLYWSLLFTGLLGIAYEVLAVRVMTQAMQNTVFSFSSALAVYLIGTAIGAAAYQRNGAKFEFQKVLTFLLCGLAISSGLGMMVLRFSREIYEVSKSVFGGGFGGSIAAEMCLATAVFLVPTLLMGATFSHLALAVRDKQGGVGRALGLNTLGSTLAPIFVGVILFSAIGAKWTMLLIAVGYLLLLPRPRPHVWVPVAALMGVLIVYPADLILVSLGPSQSLVAVRESLFGTVAISEQGPQRVLMLNGHFQMGGTGPGELSERRQAHIPALLHPDPKQVLFLGLGSGITFAAMADHPGVRGQGVELIPEVVELLPEFGEATEPLLNSDRLEVVVGDARRYVAATQQSYDLIVGDLFHPARDGAASLYTVEHFREIRERLNPGGLFCQWLPLHQIEDRVLRIIIRSYLEVFPQTRAFWAYFNVNTPMLGLVGAEDLQMYDANWLDQRMNAALLSNAANDVGIGNSFDLLGSYVGSPAALRKFVGEGPLNTDAHPIVLFEAPQIAYRGESAGNANSINFLREFQPRGDEIVDTSTESGRQFAASLDRYLQARELYLKGTLEFVIGQQQRGRQLLLQSVKTSPQFRTSYDVLLTMAEQGMRTNPVAVRQFLLELEAAAPNRSEAGEMRRWLENQ